MCATARHTGKMAPHMARSRKRAAAVGRQSQPAPASFPLRAAAVDVGSNAIRFTAAEFTSPTCAKVLDEERFPVRLGQGVFLTGTLTATAMQAAQSVLADVRARTLHLEVEHIRAVATSAVREATNQAAFLARLKAKTGISVEAISGAEEARLVHVAVRSRIPMAREPWLLVDLGGGSVEVSLVDESGILWSESHTMGSVRLLEELSGATREPGGIRRLLEEYISTLRIPFMARYREPAGMLATGGNIEALARLAGREADARGVVALDIGALRSLIDALARLSFRQRVDQLGLREDRADVILPAAMVYERIASLAGVVLIHAPGVGLREGVLLDLVADLVAVGGESDRHSREAAAAALALGRRYLFDEAHARHVATLAVELFDQLVELHGLGGADRRVLHAAALLHDIGTYVSYKRHHKHTQYLISESELAGFSPAETRLVAIVARYHRKGGPAADHEAFATLPKPAQQRARRLAAILRLADALDREHRQRVGAVHIRRSGKRVTLTLTGQGDLLLERWSLRRKSAMFEDVYGVALKVRLQSVT